MASYPKEFKLKDGSNITIRPMTDLDLQKSFEFFKKMHPEDRLFLRTDVTKKDVVARRVNPDGCDRETCIRLVVEKDGEIIADATLCRPKHGWTCHTGRMRYIISKDYQRKGLGTILARELFVAAVRENIEKIEVEIMEDNIAAIKSVERLGFLREGLLREFVTDINGDKHNLVIMSYFV